MNNFTTSPSAMWIYRPTARESIECLPDQIDIKFIYATNANLV